MINVVEFFTHKFGVGGNVLVAFIFLALAGASTQGGPGGGEGETGFRTAMYDVDYITSPTVSLVGDYDIHKTILRIECESAPTEELQLFYLAIVEDSGDSKVYHYAPTPLKIQDISLSRESVSSPTDEPFGQRITEKNSS